MKLSFFSNLILCFSLATLFLGYDWRGKKRVDRYIVDDFSLTDSISSLLPFLVSFVSARMRFSFSCKGNTSLILIVEIFHPQLDALSHFRNDAQSTIIGNLFILL